MMYRKAPIARAINAALIGLLPFSLTLQAEPFEQITLTPSYTDFGGVGLMQMPSGRMAKEGQFSFGASVNNEYHHGTVNLQLLSWLETTIRYTMVQDLLFSQNESYSGDNKYTDKGIDFKIRLLEESYWLPETSIGVRDFGGTGLFDGEFLAATKRFGNFDFTLGYGWGYLGQRGNVTNPFCKAKESFCNRDSGFKGRGGSIDYNRWFKGPGAVFGGVEYQTPYKPLRLKLEYDSNDYSGDFPVTRGGVNMTPHIPVNFGVLYQPADWLDLKLSYQRGDTLTLGVNLLTNFNDIKTTWRDGKKVAYKPGENASDPDWDKVAELLKSNAGYKGVEIKTSGDNITVKGEQVKYRNLDSAHERAGLILSQNRDKSVKTYTLVETNKDMVISQTRYDADQFDKVANNEYLGATLSDAKVENAAATQVQTTELASDFKAFNYGFGPSIKQSFGGPESFYLYAVGVSGNASYKMTPNLELAGSLYVNITDNYDRFNYVEESPHIDNFSTPRVRTLFRAYVHDNPVRMTNLQLTWFDQFGDNLFFQGYAGYLESMFAGVGGELLYRQTDANWAVGVDANIISQRDPDNWFKTYSEDFFIYKGGCPGGKLTPSCSAKVLSKGETGFVNMYYTPEWNFLKNTLFKVGYGQFLGQDRGARLDFSKQFDTGVIVGAYATLSNLTAEEFGEGSFTKGFYISVPFDVMTIKPSTQRFNFSWQPITRDGGQMLSRKYNLFSLTDGRSPWFTRPVSNQNK